MKLQWVSIEAIKKVWLISWPLIIANSFWNLQVTVDRIFLGQYSTDALGAAISAVGLFWAPMALVHQTASYLTTFVAQYSGAKQDHWIGPSVWQSIYVSLAGGLLFLLLVPLSPAIFNGIAHSENIRSLEIDYFQALCFSALPTALVAACSGFFTGLGHSKVIIAINAVGLVLNVMLDYLLIFGNFGFPAWGITGAGVATVLANFGAAFFGFYLVLSRDNERLYKIRSSYHWNKELFLRFLRFGIPSGMQWALEGLAFTAFLIFIGHLPNGDAALAASGITVTIMMIAILPALGVAQGVSVLVGQMIGEKESEKAAIFTRSGILICWAYILVMAISFVTVPEIYMNLFKSTEDLKAWSLVAEMVPTLLIFVSLFIAFDALNLVLSFTLKGAGDTRFVGLVALVVPWPLMVLPVWFVRSWENGVYWAWGFASLYIIVQALIFLARFLQGRWKSMQVISS